MKLTIDRRIWLRGEGSSCSTLYRNTDGKQCCVGIYLAALGVPTAQLVGKLVAKPGLPPLPPSASAEWLWESLETCRLYDTNDDMVVGADERESKIAAIFAKHGVEVEFTN